MSPRGNDYMRDEQPAAAHIAGSGMYTALTRELPPVFHFVDCEVTSGSAASSASLRGDGSRVAH